MSFATVINCMDGRIQEPVINFLKKRFQVQYIDSITEPGPNGLLAEYKNIELVESIFNRLAISVEKHHSVGIAIVGHYDCAGNPKPKETQIDHIKLAIQKVQHVYPNYEIIGLWVDDTWKVHELSFSSAG